LASFDYNIEEELHDLFDNNKTDLENIRMFSIAALKKYYK
jgi:hypothetical protein